jgi:hypothetical protein
METFIVYLTRACVFIAFGLCMEIIFTALSYAIDGTKTSKDEAFFGEHDDNLIGTVSLYMIPVYGIMISVFFPLTLKGMLLISLPWFGRYFVYAILISAIEAFFGWFYDKVFHVMPWDYSECKDKVFKRGYTRWFYVPLWGFAGLIIELLYVFLYNMGSAPFDAFVKTKVYLGL